MALFTNKADEIANRLDNWSMRERVFTLQHAGHQRFIGWTGQPIPMTIDSEDIRMITGTMGRFPQFRRTAGTFFNMPTLCKTRERRPHHEQRIDSHMFNCSDAGLPLYHQYR